MEILNPSIKRKILTHPQNRLLLNFFMISEESYFRKMSSVIFDEGGQVFFEDYGVYLPQETKISIDIYNFFVNPFSGQIFGAHWGRFTFFIRFNFQKLGLKNNDNLRCALTLDGSVDIRELGESWGVLNCIFEEDLIGYYDFNDLFLSAYFDTFMCGC